jgi:hypothetical protein
MSPETAPRIDPAVRTWTPDRRPIAIGTRFTIRGRLGRLPIRGTSEVVAWDPPNGARFRSVTPTWPARMAAQHTFEVDGLQTRYTWSITFEARSALAAPLVAAAARRFERAMEAQAQALTDYLRSCPPDAELPHL